MTKILELIKLINDGQGKKAFQEDQEDGSKMKLLEKMLIKPSPR